VSRIGARGTLETGGAGNGPLVSVIVLNKDEPEIAGTLELLRPQCEKAGAECLVVDASEGRLDHIRIANPWLSWIDYVKPFGAASSIPQQRNVGVHAAQGRIIAFCDAGGEPSPEWLETLVRPLLNGELSVTCGPVRSARPGVYTTINDLADGTLVERVLTANVAFTREAFDAVDGFDERYAYGSDMDFAWRLTDAGHLPTSVRSAVMGMDWGAWSLQKKRSWRYGRARGRLLRLHPGRRWRILLKGPEVVVYPTMMLTGPAFLALAALGVYAPLALWAVAFSVLRFRQRREERPWSVMLSHCIFSAAMLYEFAAVIAARLLGHCALVGHTPKDPGPYQDHLIDGLGRAGVASDYITGPTRSASVNVLLLPLRAVAGRLRGRRVHHIHWVHEYALHWARGPRRRRLLRAWFHLHLHMLKLSGTRIVWTAHNVLPHEQIFDDDAAGRRLLCRYADAVIAHNEATKTRLEERFAAETVDVIAQGVTPLPQVDHAALRAACAPADRLVLAVVGRINAYKGVDDTLRAVAAVAAAGTPVTLLIAGEPAADVVDVIGERIDEARRAGADVRANLARVSDLELAATLASADYAVYSFREIANSGSVVLALSNATPVIVRDLPALAELPDSCAHRWSGGPGDLAALLTSLAGAHPGELARRRQAARAWADDRTWERTGAATRKVYERVTRKKQR